MRPNYTGVIQIFVKFTVYGGEDLCHPENILPPGTGKTYEFLKASKRKLMSDFKESNFSYKVVTLPPETVTNRNDYFLFYCFCKLLIYIARNYLGNYRKKC